MKKRSIILASIFSLITPGLGHVYNGKIAFGAVITLSLILYYFAIFTFGILESFTGLVVSLFLNLIFYTVSIVHSAILAKNNKEYKLKKYNRIFVYFLWVAVFFLIHFANNLIVTVEANRIASESMLPTLKEGDLILSNMDIDDIKPLERGDLVIVKSPTDKDALMIQRLIALPGETIEIRQDSIFINDNFYEDKFSFAVTRSDFPGPQNFSLISVPDDNAFFLGDNRNNSYDSRYYGSVSMEDIVGKPLYIYWSKDKSRIGITL